MNLFYLVYVDPQGNSSQYITPKGEAKEVTVAVSLSIKVDVLLIILHISLMVLIGLWTYGLMDLWRDLWRVGLNIKIFCLL